MSLDRTALIRMGLLGLHASGVHRLMPRSMSGLGAILMLHRVCDTSDAAFAPNSILDVTPQFLEQTILQVKKLGYACVSLDEGIRRLESGEMSERFVVFTLDDGYRDNFTHALPIFEKHGVPFTIYLSTSLPDGTAELWWYALERVIAKAEQLDVDMNGVQTHFQTVTLDEKRRAYDRLYWTLRRMDERMARAYVTKLAQAHGVDMAEITREASLSWDELRQLAQHPLASIEAHTADHVALAAESEAQAHEDVSRGMHRIEAQLGRKPRHFSYPYGDKFAAGPSSFDLIRREFDFRSATTTRKGLLKPAHRNQMHALPRLSLNGGLQDARIVEVLLSGLPFALGKLVALN